MESSNWLRLVGIVALVLGAIYVLLPTFLIDESAAVAEQAANVDVGEDGPDLTVGFDVSGDAELGARELRDRLALRGVGVSRVEASGDGQVEVKMKLGTGRESIVAATTESGKVSFTQLSALLPDEGDEPGEATETVEALIGKLESPVQAIVTPVIGEDVIAATKLVELVREDVVDGAPLYTGLEVGAYQAEDSVFALMPDAVLPEDLGLLLVAVEGEYIGVAAGATDPAPHFVFAAFDAKDPALEQMATPLSMSYTVIAEAAATNEEPEGDGNADAEPAWIDQYPTLKSMLPDARLNLGIDLMGGIDLTLQVGLEEAVLTRANRDKATLQTDIQRDFGGDGEGEEMVAATGFFVSCQEAISAGDGSGEPLDLEDAWKHATIRADRDVPRISIETDMSLANVQTYLARRLPEYLYVETGTAEDGDSIHIFEMSDEAQSKIKSEAIEQVLETLRRRIDATGVKEPSIVKKGGGAISVQLPGLVDLDAATDAIGTTAMLEFLLVDHDLGAHLANKGLQVRPIETMVADAESAMPRDQFEDDQLLDHWLHDNAYLPEDRILRWQYFEDKELGKIRQEADRGGAIVLKYDPNPLTGADVNDAGVSLGQSGESLVLLSFKQRGSNKFCELTSANVGKRFAIMLDDVIESAPNIQDSICGGRAQITMGQSLDPQKEAQTLSLVLRTGSLNAPVNLGEVRIVGSTLGADSIRAGAIATGIGGVLVLLFMGVWYRTAGWVANFALAVNVLLVLAALCLFGANLTLPGIAGIALTVGMAVDANIIIYERIREEMRLGQHARKAVDTGFDKAMVAVLDANITTAIAGIVLFSYGTGPIKGFAVTLLIGICTTLVTALFVNRTLMESLTRSSTARLKI